MIPSWSWFHIAFGFILGVLATIFVIKIAQLSKEHVSVRKLVGTLLIFSLLVTVLFYFYVSAVSGGISAEWQFLGFPAIGEPAVKVLDIGYVETKSGNIYHSVCIDCQDKNWELVKEIPKSEVGAQFLSTSNCGTLPFLPFQQSDFVDSKSVCTRIAWGVNKISYAIDDRGQVYSWIHRYYPGDLVMPWYVEYSLYIAVAIFSSIFGGAVILLLAFFNFVGSKLRKDAVKTI